MEANPKILIIRLSSIGDIVLTTPVIRCLKKQIPGSQIHYLIKQSNHIILNNNSYIDKIFCYTNSISEVVKELKEENYTFVVDLHKQMRSFIIRKQLGRPSHCFNALRVKKWLKVKLKIDRLPRTHIVDRYLDTVKELGVVNDGKGLDYFLREEDHISPDALPNSFQDGYIAIAVGSKHNTKQMTTEMLIKICQQIDKPIILLGDKQDRKKAIKIENEVGARIFNGCGSYNLSQTAALISNSLGIITPDTGLMHIAAALDKNIISVWGNTIPEFGMGPYMQEGSKDKAHIIEVKNLRCRPCHKLGYERCPEKHFKCMNDIDLNKIIAIANSWNANQ